MKTEKEGRLRSIGQTHASRHLMAAGVFALVALLPGVASAIEKLGIDAVASGDGLTIQGMHTLGAGDNRLVACVFGVENEGNLTNPSVTYAGIPMHSAVNGQTGTSGFLARVEVFYLLEADLPADGENSVLASVDGSPLEADAHLGCTEYAGVAQTEPEATDVLVETSPDDSALSTTVDSSEGALVIVAMITGHGRQDLDNPDYMGDQDLSDYKGRLVSHDGSVVEVLEIEACATPSSVTSIGEEVGVAAGTAERTSRFVGSGLNRAVHISVSFAAAP